MKSCFSDPGLFGSVLDITVFTGDVITRNTSRLLLLMLSLGFDGSLQNPLLFSVSGFFSLALAVWAIQQTIRLQNLGMIEGGRGCERFGRRVHGSY